MSEVPDEAWESDDCVRRTIVLPAVLAERLADRAERRGLSVSDLLAEYAEEGLRRDDADGQGRPLHRRNLADRGHDPGHGTERHPPARPAQRAHVHRRPAQLARSRRARRGPAIPVRPAALTMVPQSVTLYYDYR
jgi:hypothetical protein